MPTPSPCAAADRALSIAGGDRIEFVKGWESGETGHWQFEPVEGTKYVRIGNVGQSDVACGGGRLRVTHSGYAVCDCPYGSALRGR